MQNIIILIIFTFFFTGCEKKLNKYEYIIKDTFFRKKIETGNFIKLSNGYTYYEIENTDSKDLLVFIHGFSVPSYIWDLTYNEAKGRGYGVIKLDLYGRGYSDNPDIIYNDRLFGDQVIELLDSLKINKKITLVGLSNGGRVISNIASRYYNRIEKLIYVSPSGFHDKKKAPDKSKVTDKEVNDFINEKFPTLAKGQLSDFKYPENFAGIWDLKYEELLKYKGFARAILSTAKNNYLLDEVNSKIGNTDLPLFAIWGDSDAVLPFEEIENKILKIMPKLKLFIIQDSGHLPQMEQTNTFNKIFFDKILKN
tara:strand:- start:251 stop:1180 length:930 start_codon:yes stop_codon:yes gene_type:complete